MKDLDAFIPNIRMYAPGVADPTAYFAIRQAAIEFCERTRAWRYEDEFSITGAEIDGLTAPASAVINDIDGVWFNGEKLTPKTTEQLDEIFREWRSGSTQVQGQPTYVTQTEPNTIRIVPFQTGTLKFALYLKPSQDAMEVPDFLVDQHRETIAHGALARILLIPNQSFTNPDMAAAFGMAFQQKIDGKSTIGITGQQRAPIRTKASFL